MRQVLKVCACLVFGIVKNAYIRNDAHSFTKPGGVWIPDSVCYIQYNAGLLLMFKRKWPTGFHSISCILLLDMAYIGVYLVSIVEVTCTMRGFRHIIIIH